MTTQVTQNQTLLAGRLNDKVRLKDAQVSSVKALLALVLFIGGIMEFNEVQLPTSAALFKLDCPLSFVERADDAGGNYTLPQQACTWAPR